MNHSQNLPLADQLDEIRSEDETTWQSQIKTMITVFLLATAYAVIRYNFFGDVSNENIPTYILNKSISMSAVVFLLLSSWQRAINNHQMAKIWGIRSLHFAVLHIAMSVVLLSESYYPKLYSAGKMNINGEACVLFGVLAAYVYVLLSTSGSGQRALVLTCLAAGAICIHLFFMGYLGWCDIASWPGHLPPISLISFLVGIAALVLYLTQLLRVRPNG